jgi:dTDP-4-dehydrorhamnose 3,5-epimerase
MAVATLPAGTVFRPLEAHADERGVFTELYRREWGTGVEPIQWNAVWSEAGVLRGTHVHIRHDDYLTVPVGRASIGLRDLRRGSPTEGLAALVELGRERPGALVIPRGVAHGFYFHEPSLHVYAVSEYWNRVTSSAVTGLIRSWRSPGRRTRRACRSGTIRARRSASCWPG